MLYIIYHLLHTIHLTLHYMIRFLNSHHKDSYNSECLAAKYQAGRKFTLGSLVPLLKGKRAKTLQVLEMGPNNTRKPGENSELASGKR